MRRNRCWNPADFAQTKLFERLFSQQQVSDVHWVKSASQNPNSALQVRSDHLFFLQSTKYFSDGMTQQDLFDFDLPAWELDAQSECRAARVVFAEPPHGPLHYRVPDQWVEQLQPGCRVKVPLGRSNRQMLGYCIAVETISQAPDSLKPISDLVDDDPLCTPRVLELLHWMSRYYLAPLGQVFEAAIPSGVRSAAGSRQRVVLFAGPKATDEAIGKLASSKQREVLHQLLLSQGGLTLDQLKKLADCSTAPITALRQQGLIEARHERCFQPEASRQALPKAPPLALSADQRQALRMIIGALESHQPKTILLHGVTGSGKTEVYMQAIHEVISYARQAIVLIPEISLTPQTHQRFLERFGQVAILHSHLSDVQRHQEWRRIAAGSVSVVIGARSAIFAPVPRLGLIVMDEEHEGSFKQDMLPRYHARDVALHRAHLEKVPLVLGSATPSLESWSRAQNGKYQLAKLPRRVHNRPLPEVEIIDLRSTAARMPEGAISRPLVDAMQEAFNDGGQVMLLLNRRGFATSIQCPRCGHVVACPDCDLPLTHHRDGAKACCHYCDYTIATPPVCPACKFDGIRYSGQGTQRLEIEVQRRFPSINVARMDSDTMRRAGSHERILREFREGQIQVLLGTQMIAKGHDFPNVLLVGVINADSGLHFPDFRAAEKTFQIVTQVAGRTGRGERVGRVLVQTFSPDHPAIIAASRHDYVAFASEELAKRSQFGYPPCGSLARIIFRGSQSQETENFAEGFSKQLQAARKQLQIDCRILGPATPPFARLRGKYRFHVLIQTDLPEPLNRLLCSVLEQVKPSKEVQFVVDIDPMDTL
jgi:primosomal protein N' (replication factor Y) (superfamily II helicase)